MKPRIEVFFWCWWTLFRKTEVRKRGKREREKEKEKRKKRKRVKEETEVERTRALGKILPLFAAFVACICAEA